eukprot:TRINITY_DN19154_c0_g1_i2.p1 TRINITY_DN19154_c0_g1~~TRINITY_DN19154_c0_g1_i2.p1  ORF type:complete len:4049 (-),score=1190.25 TRINITY_DN19154_c0_g1_i2:1445-12007(-)
MEKHRVALVPGDGGSLKVLVDAWVFVYWLAADGEGGAAERQVWVCADPRRVPMNANSLPGRFLDNHKLAGTDSQHLLDVPRGCRPQALRVPLEAMVQVERAQQLPGKGVVPQPCGNCALRRLVFEPTADDSYIWRPLEAFASGAAAGSACALLQMLKDPVCIGAFVPAVAVEHPDGRTVQLPVRELQTVANASWHLARGLSAEEDLVCLMDELGPLEGSAPLARLHGDRPLALAYRSALQVSMRSRCCGQHVPAAHLRCDNVEAGTSSDGRASLVVCPGEKALQWTLGGHARPAERVAALPLIRTPVNLQAEVVLHVYAVQRPSELQVWLCGDQFHIPEGALPVPGKLSVTYACCKKLELETTLLHGVAIPLEDDLLQPDSVCCLQSIEVTPLEGTSYTWLPVARERPAAHVCEYLALLQRPRLLGSLEPAVHVRYPDGNVEKTSLKDAPTVAGVVRYVPGNEAKCSPCGAATPSAASLQQPSLSASLRGYLKIRAATRCCGQCLQGMCLELPVDGSEKDVNGAALVVGPSGGAQQPEDGDSSNPVVWDYVGPGVSPSLDVAVDVWVFAFSTVLEPKVGGLWKFPGCDPPEIVWLCAEQALVPQDAKPVFGALTLEVPGGRRVSVALTGDTMSQPIRLPLEDLMGHVGPCALGRISVEPTLSEDFVWRQRQPTVHAEAITDLAGCDLGMLLQRRVEMGYFEPVVQVACPEGPLQQAAAQGNAAAATCSQRGRPTTTCINTDRRQGHVAKLPIRQFPTAAHAARFIAEAAGLPSHMVALELRTSPMASLESPSSPEEKKRIPGTRQPGRLPPWAQGDILHDSTCMSTYHKSRGALAAVLLGTVRAQALTSCCGTGLKNVSMELVGKQLDTNDSGLAEFHVRPGLHHVTSKFSEDKEACDHQIVVQPATRAFVNVGVEVTLYVYATVLPVKFNEGTEESPTSAACPEQLQVWICSSREHVRPDGLPVRGVLSLQTAPDLEFQLQIDSDHPDAWPQAARVPIEDLSFSAPCAVSTVKVTPQVADGCIWEPVEATALREQPRHDCGFSRLLRGPVLLGNVVVIVKVNCPDGQCVAIDVHQYHTVDALKQKLAASFEMESKFLRVEYRGKELEGSSMLHTFHCCPPLTLAYLGELVVQTATECCGRAAPGVWVECDGQAVDVDSQGMAKFLLPPGEHRLRAQKTSGVVTEHLAVVEPGRSVSFRAQVELQLYAYAVPVQSEDSGADIEDSIGATESQVWICADRRQIPRGAKAIMGTLLATSRGTPTVLPIKGKYCFPQALRLPVLHQSRCPLYSVHVDPVCWKGEVWRARKPSPLAEREEAMGGCEFLRLLQHPVMLGSILPSVRVTTPAGTVCKFTSREHPTVADVCRQLAPTLDAVEHMVGLKASGRVLRGSTATFGYCGGRVEVIAMGAARVKCCTACCGASIGGVKIGLYEEVFETDSDGMAWFSAEPGSHALQLRHGCFPDYAERRVGLIAKTTVSLPLQADLSFYIYALPKGKTPKAEEDASAEIAEEFDVWFSVSHRSIPAGAVPVPGVVSAVSIRGLPTTAVMGRRTEISAVKVPLTNGAGGIGACALTTLDIEPDVGCWQPTKPSPLVNPADQDAGCAFLRVLGQPLLLGSWYCSATDRHSRQESSLTFELETTTDLAICSRASSPAPPGASVRGRSLPRLRVLKVSADEDADSGGARARMRSVGGRHTKAESESDRADSVPPEVRLCQAESQEQQAERLAAEEIADLEKAKAEAEEKAKPTGQKLAQMQQYIQQFSNNMKTRWAELGPEQQAQARGKWQQLVQMQKEAQEAFAQEQNVLKKLDAELAEKRHRLLALKSKHEQERQDRLRELKRDQIRQSMQEGGGQEDLVGADVSNRIKQLKDQWMQLQKQKEQVFASSQNGQGMTPEQMAQVQQIGAMQKQISERAQQLQQRCSLPTSPTAQPGGEAAAAQSPRPATQEGAQPQMQHDSADAAEGPQRRPSVSSSAAAASSLRVPEAPQKLEQQHSPRTANDIEQVTRQLQALHAAKEDLARRSGQGTPITPEQMAQMQQIHQRQEHLTRVLRQLKGEQSRQSSPRSSAAGIVGVAPQQPPVQDASLARTASAGELGQMSKASSVAQLERLVSEGAPMTLHGLQRQMRAVQEEGLRLQQKQQAGQPLTAADQTQLKHLSASFQQLVQQSAVLQQAAAAAPATSQQHIPKAPATPLDPASRRPSAARVVGAVAGVPAAATAAEQSKPQVTAQQREEVVEAEGKQNQHDLPKLQEEQRRQQEAGRQDAAAEKQKQEAEELQRQRERVKQEQLKQEALAQSEQHRQRAEDERLRSEKQAKRDQFRQEQLKHENESEQQQRIQWRDEEMRRNHFAMKQEQARQAELQLEAARQEEIRRQQAEEERQRQEQEREEALRQEELKREELRQEQLRIQEKEDKLRQQQEEQQRQHEEVMQKMRQEHLQQEVGRRQPEEERRALERLKQQQLKEEQVHRESLRQGQRQHAERLAQIQMEQERKVQLSEQHLRAEQQKHLTVQEQVKQENARLEQLRRQQEEERLQLERQLQEQRRQEEMQQEQLRQQQLKAEQDLQQKREQMRQEQLQQQRLSELHFRVEHQKQQIIQEQVKQEHSCLEQLRRQQEEERMQLERQLQEQHRREEIRQAELRQQLLQAEQELQQKREQMRQEQLQQEQLHQEQLRAEHQKQQIIQEKVQQEHARLEELRRQQEEGRMQLEKQLQEQRQQEEIRQEQLRQQQLQAEQELQQKREQMRQEQLQQEQLRRQLEEERLRLTQHSEQLRHQQLQREQEQEAARRQLEAERNQLEELKKEQRKQEHLLQQVSPRQQEWELQKQQTLEQIRAEQAQQEQMRRQLEEERRRLQALEHQREEQWRQEDFQRHQIDERRRHEQEQRQQEQQAWIKLRQDQEQELQRLKEAREVQLREQAQAEEQMRQECLTQQQAMKEQLRLEQQGLEQFRQQQQQERERLSQQLLAEGQMTQEQMKLEAMRQEQILQGQLKQEQQRLELVRQQQQQELRHLEQVREESLRESQLVQEKMREDQMKQEKAIQEELRREQGRLQQVRLHQQQELQRLEALRQEQHLTQAKLQEERARQEQVIQEQLQAEQQRLEQVRQQQQQEMQRFEMAKQEQLRQAQEQLQLSQQMMLQEHTRQEQAMQEQLRLEQQRLEEANQQQLRQAQEHIRQEQLRHEHLLQQQMRKEQERLEQVRQEQHAELQRLEQVRREKERFEHEQRELQRREEDDRQLRQAQQTEELRQAQLLKEQMRRDFEHEQQQQQKIQREAMLRQEAAHVEFLRQQQLHAEAHKAQLLHQERMGQDQLRQRQMDQRQQPLHEEVDSRSQLQQDQMEELDQQQLRRKLQEQEAARDAQLEQMRMRQEESEKQQMLEERTRPREVQQAKSEPAEVRRDELEDKLDKLRQEQQQRLLQDEIDHSETDHDRLRGMLSWNRCECGRRSLKSSRCSRSELALARCSRPKANQQKFAVMSWRTSSTNCGRSSSNAFCRTRSTTPRPTTTGCRTLLPAEWRRSWTRR